MGSISMVRRELTWPPTIHSIGALAKVSLLSSGCVKSTATIENEPVIDRYDRSSNAHWWAGVGHAVSPGNARFYVRDRAVRQFWSIW